MSTQTAPTGYATGEVSKALADLAGALDGFRFVLPSPGRAERERERSELIRSIREYLLPRLADRDAPLVAGFFGAGGVGKSLILNSLAQKRVAVPGAVRPSTRAAVIWAHRDHAARYWREFLLQVQERVGPAVETILGDDPLTKNLTLIDTPSFDTVSPEGTRIAHDVLAVADLCVFVASATRYADSASWDFVRLARRRGLPILFVLNRLPDSAPTRATVIADYVDRLAEAGLLLEPDPSLVLPVSEQAPESHGGLPATAVASLRRELEELADREFRTFVSAQAMRGAVTDLIERVRPLVDALATEGAAAAALVEPVQTAYTEAAGELGDALIGARLGPEDVAARQRLARIVTHLAGRAAQQAAAAWDAHPVGRILLEGGGRSLWRHGPATLESTSAALERWEATIADLAVERAGRVRLRRRLGRAAVAAALAPDDDAPRRLTRALSEEGAQVLLRWSRRTLFGDLGDVLRADSTRFLEEVGDPAALRRAGEALVAAVDRLAAVPVAP